VAATVDGGREAAAWFMRLKPRPSAVATFNDAQAIGFMAALRELGLEVPGDVSVIGDDDIGASSLVRPALTTVAQPIAEIGSLSTELLIDSIEGEADRARTIMLPPKLVVRASTGPAQPGGAARPRSMRADKA